MKIALSTTMIQRGKTGVAQYVFALGKALLDLPGEHRLAFLVLEEDRPLFDFAEGRADIIPVAEKYRSAVKNILWHQAILPGVLRKIGADVLHVPSYRRLLWRKPCALVSTIHDLAPFHVQGKYDPARMFYGRVVVRRLARRQDDIIAVSTNTAQDIERYFGIPLERQHVVLNGLDTGRFHPGDRAAALRSVRKLWNLDAPYFLYISRLEHPGKNHVRLIEAFTRFKQATGSPWLLALGGSDWHGAEAIHAAAAASPFAADIRFTGFVPDETLPDLYRAAGGMVYPSLFEGFGFPPVEAMACNCPVISSTRGALAEVVRDAALTIEPEDIPGMVRALTQLASQPELAGQLRALGRENVQRFRWDHNAAAVLRICAQAVARRRGTPVEAAPTLRTAPVA